MTKRCRHEPDTKDGYPDDIICMKCMRIWHISEWMNKTAKELQHTAPIFVRQAVLHHQAEEFNYKNPDYYRKVNEWVEA